MTQTMALNTHAFIKRFKSTGMDEKQAEAITEAIVEVANKQSGDLATKDFVAAQISDVKGQISDVKAQISDVKVKLIMWVIGISFAQMTVTLAVVSMLLK